MLKMAVTEKAAKPANICVSNLSNSTPTMMLPGITNPPPTDRYDDELSLKEDNDQFSEDKNRLHLTLSKFQSMIDPAMIGYKENMLRRLADGEIQHTRENLLKTLARKQRRKLSVICRVLWKIFSSRVGILMQLTTLPAQDVIDLPSLRSLHNALQAVL